MVKSKGKFYSYYYPCFISSEWLEIPKISVVNSVLNSCPYLSADYVESVLKREGDGHFFDFEIDDWIEYFLRIGRPHSVGAP